ncbi:putative leucine-rich repeat receptor-like serine/threonine-protein kinase [Cucumis melo var. makuwa]|uniref:Leucine-rich repeat receptor-like serine/threonine-protein kinase n=1 Tax=Cucumis melo var. makuwa TaxID=1194695 RepID=A0A5A7VN79_CUCMM|nr:putative leucine-rich repeat receptor-like serine/threonine-protein kinase [Cucumis melo var. makuwa]
MVAYRTLLGHCNAYLNSLDKCYANCELSSPNEGNLRYLGSQGLAGTLPSQLFKLPYLDTLDLTLNYLAGEIPREWGSTKLVNIYLFGNRLTGSIPEEIGNITTLKRLHLGSNQLSGSLPSTLGNLSKLRMLGLSSNNFTGELPVSLGMLTNLTYL